MKTDFKRDFHYVWLGNTTHTLQFYQYLSILSTIKYGNPDSITIWSETDIDGEYFDKIKDKVTIQKIVREKEIFGNPIIHTELHGWSDIYRNMIIYEQGGIYCDFDIIWCKDIAPLLDTIDTFAIAYQGIDGREGCNMGVMIGDKGSKFCEEYLQLFKKYGEYEQKNHIGIFSTQYPKLIAEALPDVTILPHTTFHWPLYHTASMKWFYSSNADNENTLIDPLSGLYSSDELLDNYAHHCFYIHNPDFEEFTNEEFILTQDTSFTKKVRPLLL